MKETWYTLAVSDIGTHKMRFKDRMEHQKAVALGQSHCDEKGYTYIGTFDAYSIDTEELLLRSHMYI